MADDIQSNRIVCEGGLDSTDNHILLSEQKPGAATNLINYEVGLTGGYRRINGFMPFDTNFPEVGVGIAEGPVLGIAIFENLATETVEFISARKDIGANTYKLYLYDVVDGWEPITTGFTLNWSTSLEKVRHAYSNDGAGNYIVFADGVNPATIFDGLNWGQITSAHTGASIAQAGGNQVVDAPANVTFFEKTLFLCADPDYKGVVSYSAAGTFYDFTSASGGGQLLPGMEVLVTKPFRESLYIFGRNGIKKAVADVTAGFLTSNVTENIGILSPDAIVEIGGDLIFLAPDGFRPIAGTSKIGDVQLEVLSKSIQNLVRARTYGNANLKVNPVVIRGKSQFRMFIGDDSRATEDSQGIIAGMRTADQMNGWEFGELRGIRASTSTSRYIGGEEYVLHGDYDGNVYRQEIGYSFNGQPIFCRFMTPYIDFGDTEVRKVPEKVKLFIRTEGDFNITMSVDYDWGDIRVPTPAPYLFEFMAEPPIYGGGFQYGDGSIYGGAVLPLVSQNIQGSFFSARFDFVSNDDKPSYAIHGFVVEYTTTGRL